VLECAVLQHDLVGFVNQNICTGSKRGDHRACSTANTRSMNASSVSRPRSQALRRGFHVIPGQKYAAIHRLQCQAVRAFHDQYPGVGQVEYVLLLIRSAW
jgi:hypothetical protein